MDISSYAWMLVGLLFVAILFAWYLGWSGLIRVARYLEGLRKPERVAIAFGALFVITFISIHYSSVEGNSYKHLYDVLRVFTFSANDFKLETLTKKNDLPLLIMIWVDTVFMVTAFLSLVVKAIVRSVIARDIPSKHIIIFGLGEWGLHYAKALAKSNFDVVVIDKDPSDAAVEEVIETWADKSYKGKRIRLIKGDCLDDDILKKAKVDEASKILPLLESDGNNIDAAYQVRKHLRENDQADQVILLPVDDIRLSTSLASYKRFSEHHGETEIRFFNIMQQAAVRHLINHPPELYADIFGQKNVHFAIYGLGDFAINLIYVIAQIGHYRTWPLDADPEKIESLRVKITIYDQKPESEAMADLKGLFPNLDKVIDYQYISTALMSLDLYQEIMWNHKLDRPVTQHIFCMNNETLAVRYATKLRKAQTHHANANTPIFVRSLDGTGVARLIESNCGEEEWPDNIFPLTLLSDNLGENDYFSENIENIAKAFNDYKLEDKAFTKKEAGERWGEISADFKHSSFYQAFFLSSRLRAVGYHWKLKGENVVNDDTWELKADLHKHIARLEHDRWKSERWLLSWDTMQKGESRTLGDIARIHPELEDKVSNALWYSNYDIEQAENLPKYLDKAGCELTRLNTNALVEPENLNLIIEANEIVMLSLLDGKARKLIEKYLTGGLEAKRVFAFLPLPYEIIKSLAGVFSKVRKLEIDTEDQKTYKEIRAEKLLGHISKLAGSVGTYIEMPLIRPFGNWQEVKPKQIDLLEQVLSYADFLNNEVGDVWKSLTIEKQGELAAICKCEIKEVKIKEEIEKLIENWNVAQEQLKWVTQSFQNINEYIMARSDNLKIDADLNSSYMIKPGLKEGEK